MSKQIWPKLPLNMRNKPHNDLALQCCNLSIGVSLKQENFEFSRTHSFY